MGIVLCNRAAVVAANRDDARQQHGAFDSRHELILRSLITSAGGVSLTFAAQTHRYRCSGRGHQAG